MIDAASKITAASCIGRVPCPMGASRVDAAYPQTPDCRMELYPTLQQRASRVRPNLQESVYTSGGGGLRSDGLCTNNGPKNCSFYKLRFLMRNCLTDWGGGAEVEGGGPHSSTTLAHTPFFLCRRTRLVPQSRAALSQTLD